MLTRLGIINNATRSSLILLDEVGRGTSPDEAIALAYGILRYIDEKMECRALFATHFTRLHENVELARKRFTRLVSYSSDMNAFGNVGFYKSQVLIEDDGRVIYTYRFGRGVSDCSHGLLVARMAGVPDEIIEAADEFIRRDKIKD